MFLRTDSAHARAAEDRLDAEVSDAATEAMPAGRMGREPEDLPNEGWTSEDVGDAAEMQAQIWVETDVVPPGGPDPLRPGRRRKRKK